MSSMLIWDNIFYLVKKQLTKTEKFILNNDKNRSQNKMIHAVFKTQRCFDLTQLNFSLVHNKSKLNKRIN